eukprot:gene26401-35044_t
MSSGNVHSRAGSNPRGRIVNSQSNSITSSSTASHRANYSNSHSKEQLIKLQIDIEDRGKVCTILQNKIDKQRCLLSNIEREVKEQYQQVLEDEIHEHKASAEKFIEQSNKLMAEKEELLSSCKDLIETIKEKDKSLAAEIREFLSLKAAEFKEQVSKILQPEMNRLNLLHEREMGDIEQQANAAEREARELYARRLQQDSDNLRQQGQEDIRQASRLESEQLSATMESERIAHSTVIARQQALADREQERLRAQLSERSVTLKASFHKELKEHQEAGQVRLLDLKNSHSSALENIRREHEKQVRALQRTGEAKSVETKDSFNESKSISRLQHHYRNRHDDFDDRRAGGRPDRSHDSDDLSESIVPSPRAIPEVISQRHPASLQQLSSVEEDDVDDALSVGERTQLEQARDKLQQKVHKEREQALQAIHVEEKHYEQSLKQLRESLADLVVNREKLLQSVSDCKQREATYLAEQAQLEREIAVYRDGIAAHRGRMRDVDTVHQLRGGSRQVVTLTDLCDKLSKELSEAERLAEQDLNDISFGHKSELQTLDAKVKADVNAIEEEMLSVRDELDTERVKMNKLEKLVQQYSSSTSSTSSVSTATTASKGTFRSGNINSYNNRNSSGGTSEALCYSGSNLYQQFTQNCNSQSSYNGQWYCATIEVCEQYISSARQCMVTRGCATAQQCSNPASGVYSNTNLLVGNQNPAGMTITISCCLANNFASDDTVAIDYTKICNSALSGVSYRSSMILIACAVISLLVAFL